jgi:hypothetical protein
MVHVRVPCSLVAEYKGIVEESIIRVGDIPCLENKVNVGNNAGQVDEAAVRERGREIKVIGVFSKEGA